MLAMRLHMLDTNIVSLAIRDDKVVMQHLEQTPITALCVSAVTCGELVFGLKKNPEAKKLKALTEGFLRRVQVLPFDERVAHDYGAFRAAVMAAGYGLSALDMQIAAHAYSVGAVLISRDQAFGKIPGLDVQDWIAG